MKILSRSWGLWKANYRTWIYQDFVTKQGMKDIAAFVSTLEWKKIYLASIGFAWRNLTSIIANKMTVKRKNRRSKVVNWEKRRLKDWRRKAKDENSWRWCHHRRCGQSSHPLKPFLNQFLETVSLAILQAKGRGISVRKDCPNVQSWEWTASNRSGLGRYSQYWSTIRYKSWLLKDTNHVDSLSKS